MGGQAAEKVGEPEEQLDDKASENAEGCKSSDNAEEPNQREQPTEAKKSATENDAPEGATDANNQPKTGNEFDKVIELMKAQKLDEAADKLRELLMKSPDDHILL